jgi:hypothetical protein
MPFWEVEECSPRSFITALLLKEEPVVAVCGRVMLDIGTDMERNSESKSDQG